MRRIFFIIFFYISSIFSLFSSEYVCIFDTTITADLRSFTSNSEEVDEVRSKLKFVFDITPGSLIINGEEYIQVYESKNHNFIIYSNVDLPYIMFHYYPLDSKIIMLGMQETATDTFLKSEVLSCKKPQSTPETKKEEQKPVEEKVTPTTNTQATSNKSILGDMSTVSSSGKEIASNDSALNNTKEIIIPPPK